MAPAESERKVDLASLVLHYKKVKRFLAPLRYVYQRLDDLLRYAFNSLQPIIRRMLDSNDVIAILKVIVHTVSLLIRIDNFRYKSISFN